MSKDSSGSSGKASYASVTLSPSSLVSLRLPMPSPSVSSCSSGSSGNLSYLSGVPSPSSSQSRLSPTCESEQHHVVILVRNKGLPQLETHNMWWLSWYENEKAKGLVANLVAVRVRLLGAQQGQRVRGVGLRECIVLRGSQASFPPGVVHRLLLSATTAAIA